MDTSSSENKSIIYESIVNSNYINPKDGTKQQNMTKEDIKEKLSGFRTLNEKNYKYLLTLPIFKTWIRYYNPKTKQFRIGGLLMKVDPELRFIMLVNTGLKKSWSVQLKDNIIFVPDPKYENDINKQNKDDKDIKYKQNKDDKDIKYNKQNDNIKKKEYLIKEKLYKLYLEGNLKKESKVQDIPDPEKIKECAKKDKLYNLYLSGKLKII
jgi:hypothetical protein